MAKGGGTSARPRAVEEEQRNAWAPARSRGGVGEAAQSGGQRGDTPAALNRGVGLRWKKKDPFAISKNSRDHSVNKQ